jgi:hypothetical protein
MFIDGNHATTDRDEDIWNYRQNHKFNFDYEQLPAWKADILQIEGTKVEQLTETVKDPIEESKR